jgi:hypothetical protein
VVNYLLVLMTHGTHGPTDTLERTLASFLENVTPAPARVYLHQDGPGSPHFYREGGFPVPLILPGGFEALGFCGATRRAWADAASLTEHDYVFWLEHDFTFDRPVALVELAALLDGHPTLAQVSLMRGPENAAERAAGGLYEAHPEAFEARTEWFDWFGGPPGDPETPHELRERPWLDHAAYFTTTPSLMTRGFMAENPWPVYPSECEGRFGLDLVGRGYRFAVWGSGEHWVTHIGTRSGFGY